MSSAGGAGAAASGGEHAPFNVTGVNPAANILPGANNAVSASLAVTNVKRIWGAATEETKAQEASSASSTGAHVNQHYGGQNNLN